MKNLILFIIGFYQKAISHYNYGCCRFTPTCSTYAYQSIEKFGCCKGLLLALKRFMKCNPFSKKFGYDPIPDKYNIKFFDKMKYIFKNINL